MTNINHIDSDPAQLISESEAAQLLSVSVPTLRRMALRDQGPPRLRLSLRRIAYRVRDVRAFAQNLSSAQPT